MGRLVRSLITLSVTLCALCGAPAAFAVDSGDIVVATSKGEVHFVIGGSERALASGALLVPPATVRTGHDGAVELRQGATSVSIGPDTVLEFPALKEPGGPIDRIVQPRGNAFYDIGKRAGRKLRVETPYLVGVVKGTQFNVAAQDATSTISLFEGLLEIHAADDSDVIDIKAGEVASSVLGDHGITVIKMDATTPPMPRPTRSPDGGNTAPASKESSHPVNAPRDVDSVFAARGVPAAAGTTEAVNIQTPAAVRVETPGITAPSSVGEVAASVATVDIAPGAAAGNVELRAGTELQTATSVDLATGNLNSAAVAAPAELSNVGATLNVSMEPIAGTAGAAASVDLATTGNPPVVETGVSAGVEVASGNGNANVSISVGGVDLNTGVDLGLTAEDSQGASSNSGSGNSGNGNTNNGSGNGGESGNGNSNSGSGSSTSGNGANSGPGNVVDDVHGLIDSLTHKPGKK